ncbi:MAG: hypothetical protein JW803_08485 [Endomicrobiales bacterium]|nr:hypothetical protein [Endomicrobiales bacterium]
MKLKMTLCVIGCGLLLGGTVWAKEEAIKATPKEETVLKSTNTYNINDEITAYYNNLKLDIDKYWFNQSTRDKKIIWMLGDWNAALSKNFINEAIPVLIQDIRQRIKDNDLPSKEGEDYTFRTLIGLSGDKRIQDLYIEIIETCKNEEGIRYAIPVVKGYKGGVVALKKVLKYKSYLLRVNAADELFSVGKRMAAFTVYKEVAEMKDFKKADEMLMLRSVRKLAEYKNSEATAIIKQAIINGPSEKVKNEARELYDKIQKGE